MDLKSHFRNFKDIHALSEEDKQAFK